jgi:hypothetical protein
MLDDKLIRTALQEFDCSADFLCSVAGISSTKLSRHLNQIQPMAGPELANLLNVIAEMRALTEDARPYPVAFRKADLIKRMLERRRTGRRFIPIEIGGAAQEELATK